MGYEEIKVNGIGTSDRAAVRENLEKAYDITHGVPEEPSIWDNFSPLALGSSILFPFIVNSKEIQAVPLDATLTGKAARANKYRMIRTNEISAFAERLKSKNPFLTSDILTFQNEIKNLQNSGRVTKAQFDALNKKYFQLLSKTSTGKMSFVQRGLANGAAKSPGVLGGFTKSFKNNKIILAIEVFQELLAVGDTFMQHGSEAGMKQIVKSTGKVAAGFSGFLAGSAAGTWAGAKLGALIGSVIPGAGTVVGGLIGSVLGFAIGGFTSQLARAGYDKIIPPEKQLAQDKKYDSMLSATDTSPETQQALQNEIAICYNYLSEVGPLLQQAKESKDTINEPQIRVQMRIVKNAMDSLDNAYKEKFGISVVSQIDSQMQAETESSPTQSQSSTTSTNNNISMMQNPYLQTPVFNGYGFNGTMPMQDWSAMLPAGTSQQLFGIA